jgi:hypothetical protein
MHINNTPKTKNKFRQKQYLVHKVPSGVAILSHVCGVAAIFHFIMYVAIKKYRETRNSCLLFVKSRNGNRHLVI